MSIFSTHVPYGGLVDYAERRLAAADQESVQTHLAECNSCARHAAVLLKMMGLMRADRTQGASPEAFQWVNNLIRTRAAATSLPPIRKILAVLQSELAPFAPVFGERSGPSAVRQLFYQADANAIDLQITSGKEGLVVAGQLLGSCDLGEVELAGAQGSEHVTLTESGEFDFSQVSAGDYKLWVRWARTEIEVTDLKL
jgi:hypothetical protein